MTPFPFNSRLIGIRMPARIFQGIGFFFSPFLNSATSEKRMMGEMSRNILRLYFVNDGSGIHLAGSLLTSSAVSPAFSAFNLGKWNKRHEKRQTFSEKPSESIVCAKVHLTKPTLGAA